MYKLNRKLIIISLSCIFCISFGAISYVEMISNATLIDAAKETLRYESDRQALLFNRDLREVERTTSDLVKLVETSFDEDAFFREPNYIESYIQQIEKNVKRSAQEARLSKSAYVYFVPEMDQKPHDIWFADLNFDGVVERQTTFPLSYYDGDVKWKQWYYMPYTTQKPYWTEPYLGTIEADQDIIYFSYTAPIVVRGHVVGVAGADYYFNQVKESLSHFSFDGKGYAILVDQNFKVLIHPEISSGVNLLEYEGGKYAEMMEKIKLQSSGPLEYSGGKNREDILYYNQLDNGWYLMLGMNHDEMAQTAHALDLVKWGVVLAGTVIGFFILFTALKRNSHPILAIKESLDQMRQGNYDHEVAIEHLIQKDELGEIAKTVEQLRCALKEKYSSHLDQHEALAEVVREKTLELSKTNEFLEISLAQLQEQNAEMNIANEKYESQLEKLQQLQIRLFQSEQMASLAYILVGLAYDLNSPIGNSTTMISFLKSERNNLLRKIKDNQLKKQDLDEFTATLGESLDLLERNLALAINQVTQFKRLSSGHDRHLESDFRLKETLAFLFSQSTLGTVHNIRLNLSVPDINIRCDLGAFIQVFSNLIKYSLQYSYDNAIKGMINIKCEEIGPGSLMFVYEDFGIATPAELVETAFVPYLTTLFQEQPQIVQLNICYHLITKIFEGSIKYEHCGDEGNRFYMMMKIETKT